MDSDRPSRARCGSIAGRRQRRGGPSCGSRRALSRESSRGRTGDGRQGGMKPEGGTARSIAASTSNAVVLRCAWSRNRVLTHISPRVGFFLVRYLVERGLIRLLRLGGRAFPLGGLLLRLGI